MVTTEEHKAAILRHVYYEIARCVFIQAGEQQFDEWWVSHIMHARVLMDFFECKRLGNDDVGCTDFGFPKQSLSISEWYRHKMNKDLAHLTYSRAKRTLNTQIWVPEDVIGPIRTVSREFVQHIVTSPPSLADQKELECWREMLILFDTGQGNLRFPEVSRVID